MRSLLLLIAASSCLTSVAPAAQEPGATPGAKGEERWVASLETQGGPLEFGLELERRGEGWRAYLVNEPERIPVDDVVWNEHELRIPIPHYDSWIEARREGEEYRGTWRKVRGKDKTAVVPFRARPGHRLPPRPVLAVLPKHVGGRWAVDFESDDLPAVAVFEQAVGSNRLSGTFLTATGDYRYLAGHVTGAELVLSCFDGAHAFLFEARVQNDGTLSGTFHSGNWWSETWTARRDEDARPVDAFHQTSWGERASPADVVYPDTKGELKSLGDPDIRGKAYLLQVFGSWCPNCHDETRYLVELHRKYAARGLSIVGLAYELTGDFERDAAQVERFAERHGIEYPLLVAGTANKGDATAALGVLDRVRSYPTTIFLTGDGTVRAVHSGFAGPATGEAHRALRGEFETLIEELLAADVGTDAQRAAALASHAWSERHDGSARGILRFEERESGLVALVSDGQGDRVAPVHLLGDAVYVGERVLRHEPETSLLVDVQDFGRRYAPEGSSATPLFAEARLGDPDFLRAALRSSDMRARREAVVAAALAGALDREAWDDAERDATLEVRIALAWAAGHLREEERRDALLANLDHPNATLRRESVRALLAFDDPALEASLADHADDPDPWIRALLR